MKWLMLILLTMAHAEQKEEKGVVDLGELKVQGEVRRPTTDFYQLKVLTPKQLDEIAELSFTDFEKQLLKDLEIVHEPQ